MDLSAIDPILLLARLMVAATPILLAAIGELVTERAGVLNLGVEGMMITGAVCGFIIAYHSGSPWLGFLCAALGGAFLALLFSGLTQIFLSNQVATGLGLTLFGLGLSALLGQGYNGIKAPAFPDLHLPLLADIPVIGPIFFQHDPMVYIGLLLVAGVGVFLRYSRAGLILRAVGENHDAAHALGYHVVRVRVAAIVFGGACAGLGGAYISLVRVPQWTEGMTAGAGWIALAIVVFAGWKPWRLLLGAWLFGGVSALQLNLQGAKVSLLELGPWLLVGILAAILANWIWRRWRYEESPSRNAVLTFACAGAIAVLLFGNLTFGWGLKIDETLWLNASPYIATIVVLVVMNATRAPGSLGKLFHASH